jgi:hypothetical protein
LPLLQVRPTSPYCGLSRTGGPDEFAKK